MSLTEIAGFVTGALCVWLIVKQKTWNFPVGVANNMFFIVLFAEAGLYADAGLQVVYIGLALMGWYWWLHGGANRGRLVVRPTPRSAWLRSDIALYAGKGLWLTSVLYAVFLAGRATPIARQQARLSRHPGWRSAGQDEAGSSWR